MKIEKLARKGIFNIISYIPGKSIEEVQNEFEAKRWTKLASNENLLGPSPKALIPSGRNFLKSIFIPKGLVPF